MVHRPYWEFNTARGDVVPGRQFLVKPLVEFADIERGLPAFQHVIKILGGQVSHGQPVENP